MRKKKIGIMIQIFRPDSSFTPSGSVFSSSGSPFSEYSVCSVIPSIFCTPYIEDSAGLEEGEETGDSGAIKHVLYKTQTSVK